MIKSVAKINNYFLILLIGISTNLVGGDGHEEDIWYDVTHRKAVPKAMTVAIAAVPSAVIATAPVVRVHRPIKNTHYKPVHIPGDREYLCLGESCLHRESEERFMRDHVMYDCEGHVSDAEKKREIKAQRRANRVAAHKAKSREIQECKAKESGKKARAEKAIRELFGSRQ